MPDDVLAGTTAPAVAPAPQPSAAPIPVAAPPAPTPSAAPQSPPPPPATAAPAAPSYSELLTKLGYQSEDDLARDLAFTRQAREQMARAQQERLRQDPEHQAARQRAEALHRLNVETYGREAAEAMRELPDLLRETRERRGEVARNDFKAALDDAGLVFDGSKEQAELVQFIEDSISDRLNADPKLNDRFFESPAERAAVLREMVGRFEKLINHAMIRQGAQTLREHAQRVRSAPRQNPLPVVKPPTITATDSRERRHQANAETRRQLADIHAHYAR